MRESYTRFFQLTGPAFFKEVADKDLWLPPSKQDVVDAICEAVHDRSQVLLYGEPGVGKTCVYSRIHRRLAIGPAGCPPGFQGASRRIAYISRSN